MEIPLGPVPASELQPLYEFQSKIFGPCNGIFQFFVIPNPLPQGVLPGVVRGQTTSTNSEDRGFPFNGKVP